MMVQYYRHITQVIDGVRYEGRLHIGGVKLDYRLEFAFPIPRLAKMTVPEDVAGLRKFVRIKIWRDKLPVELTDGEYHIFNRLLTDAAIEFHDDPQTRADQKGLKGVLARGYKVPGVGFRVLIPSGETKKGRINFSPEFLEVLSSPKFGCVLA